MSVDAVTVSRAVAFADVAESLVEAGDDAVARAGAALRRLILTMSRREPQRHGLSWPEHRR